MVASLVVRSLRAGEAILTQGERSSSFYIVVGPDADSEVIAAANDDPRWWWWWRRRRGLSVAGGRGYGAACLSVWSQ